MHVAIAMVHSTGNEKRFSLLLGYYSAECIYTADTINDRMQLVKGKEREKTETQRKKNKKARKL